MEISIIDIGNSKGIRLSKTILEKYKLKDKLQIQLEEDHIILRPIPIPRQDWEAAFEQMRLNGHDRLLIEDIFDDENLEE